MKKTPISDEEKNLLRSEIQKEKDDVPRITLFMVALFTLFIFLPGRNGHPSFYREYGFLKPVIISTLLAFGLSYGFYKKSLKALVKDLNSGEKVVEQKVVWKKEKSWVNGKYIVRIDSSFKDFQTFNVSEEDYNKIEYGHIVFLEYGENSKTLFKLDLNIK